jgi:hypothetical protein
MKRAAGAKGRAGRTGGTTEEQEWHGKPLAERLRVLRSGEGIPSFIDKATIDDRIKWLENEINTPGGLGARPKKDGRKQEGPGISGEARDEAQTDGGSAGEGRMRAGAGAGRRGSTAQPPEKSAAQRRQPGPGLGGEQRSEVE